MPTHLIVALLHCYSTFEDKPALFQLLKPQSLCEWPGAKVNSQINFDDTRTKTPATLPIPLEHSSNPPPPQKKPLHWPYTPRCLRADWVVNPGLLQEDGCMVVSMFAQDNLAVSAKINKWQWANSTQRQHQDFGALSQTRKWATKGPWKPASWGIVLDPLVQKSPEANDIWCSVIKS